MRSRCRAWGQAAQAVPDLARWRTQDSGGGHRSILVLTSSHKGRVLTQGQAAQAGTHLSRCCMDPRQLLRGWHQDTLGLAHGHKAVVMRTQGQVAEAEPYLTRWCTAAAGPHGVPALLRAPSGGSSAAGGHCRRSMQQGHQMRGRVGGQDTSWLCLCLRQDQTAGSRGPSAMAHTTPPSVAIEAGQLVWTRAAMHEHNVTCGEDRPHLP